MFDLSDRPIVWIPIKWAGLKPGTGAKSLAVEGEHYIDVQVELLDRDEIIAEFDEYFSDEVKQAAGILTPAADGEGADELDIETEFETDEDNVTKAASMREVEVKRFMRLVKAWRKVVNNGQPVDLTEDNVRKILRAPGFATAFEASYLSAIGGKMGIRRGN